LLNRYILLTNNSTFAPRAGVDLEVIEGDAFEVFTRAKSRVLAGCRLLNHPLYGNFTPQQQPFRSLLLSCPKDEHGKNTDNMSYQMIESALERYSSHIHNLPGPEDYREDVRRDYAFLDRMLLEEVFLSCCKQG